MLITATGRPLLNSMARRSTVGGTGTPTVAIKTAEDWVGWRSHFALPSRGQIDLRVAPFEVFPVCVVTSASPRVRCGTGERGDSGGFPVNGVHVLGVQDVGLLHVAQV